MRIASFEILLTLLTLFYNAATVEPNISVSKRIEQMLFWRATVRERESVTKAEN